MNEDCTATLSKEAKKDDQRLINSILTIELLLKQSRLIDTDFNQNK